MGCLEKSAAPRAGASASITNVADRMLVGVRGDWLPRQRAPGRVSARKAAGSRVP